MYSSNEFDSDDFDQEVRLYTQLYFGNNLEPSQNLQSNSNNNEFSSTDQSNKELVLQLEKNADMKINEVEKLSNNSRNIHENKVSCRDDPVISGSTTPKDMNKLSKKVTPKKKKTQLKIVATKRVKVDITNNTKKSKRKRNPSICSIDSISGREPLDSLYCQIEDERLDFIEELDESHCDKSLLSNKSYNKDNLIEDEPEGKISEVIKGSQLKKKLQNKVDIESSDDEICVLPLNQSDLVQISTVEDCISSSDSSVEIIKCIKQKKIKANKKTKKNSRKEQKNKSPSTDSENDMLEMSPKTPIVFKFGSEIISTVKKTQQKSRVKKFSKSCVIFSKNRPLTKKTPSCPQWTTEMASLYDSDYSDEFSVEDIHRSQSRNRRLWKICAEDYQGPKKKNLRYFDRCTRCREFGHNVSSCPRTPHCLLCASPDHNRYTCPKRCCLYCGNEPHKICNLTFRSNTCSDGTVPVVPDKPSIRNRYDAYCYNCAKKGHFGHECRFRRYDDSQSSFKKLFCPVSMQIFNYGTVYPFPMNEVVDLNKNDDDIEVVSPEKKKFATNSPVKNNPNNEVSVVNKAQLDSTTTTLLSITPNQVNKFIKRQKLIAKEIGKLIAFKGPPKSVDFAERILFFLIRSTPNFKHKALIKSFNMEQMRSMEHLKPNDTVVNQCRHLQGNNKDSKPVKILIESACNKSGLSSKAKAKETKIKNDDSNVGRNNCLTQVTPGSPKVSLNYMNYKTKYLPFPLPYSRQAVFKAYQKALMYFGKKKFLQIVDDTLLYFNGNIPSLYSDPNFFFNFQCLACIAHLQLREENKPSVHKMISKFRKDLEELEGDIIDEKLHKVISMSYSKIASPDINDVHRFIELANKYRKEYSKISKTEKRKQKRLKDKKNVQLQKKKRIKKKLKKKLKDEKIAIKKSKNGS
ncbi:Zinc finger CCHC domain-containing protein 7 [Armadillidium vulgare]|nr:Zinc finger CCHC domain-containing protein 7 [Armadillidium vulgare]